MPNYRVRVDAAGLEDGTADKPILLERVETGRVTRHRALLFQGVTAIVYQPDEPLQDGTRVWIETSECPV
jgi:hypothetical protein